MFIHLAAHSAYSLQEGLALPAELAQAAAAAGMPALGLTDHRLLSGAVEFAEACRQAGIQPIFGLEVDLPQNRLALLAMNLEGWSNLCRLSSTLALRENPEAPCPLNLLDEYNEGLLALSHERGNDGATKLARLKEIFPERLYISMQEPSTALQLVALARRVGLPTVVTHPLYYLKPEQAELQRTLAAIRLNQARDTLPQDAPAPAGAYFLDWDEMERRFEHFPRALAATQEITEKCRFELPLGVPHMPVIPLPEGMTAAQALRSRAEAGARRLYGAYNPQVRERLDRELEVIGGMGYEPIFLIVEEILNYARKTGAPFSSRGSAASSLVAHTLGITSPDPLRLDLYFERFLNPARKSPPDIDTDLCSRRREGVIRHVFETFGEENVAMVGTVNRFRPRSALGEVAKAHGLAQAMAREMVESLPYGFWYRIQEVEGQTPPSPFAELRAKYAGAQFQRIFDEAEALLKLPRHLSVHAGGVVVGPGRLTDLVPLMRSGEKGVTITQMDHGAVEAMGLVKIDLLGIRGLTVQGDVAEFIQASRAGEYATPLQVLDSIPEEDAATSERVESGGTIGCFQIESPGMRATLKEIHARTPDDIMAALALYRPGPLTGGLKDAFVRRFKGEEPVEHIHPALSGLLQETFGVILYQEQVLRIAHELAGFSLAEADLLRRAMSHFDPGKQMKALQEKFVEQAEWRSGVPRETGERIWEMMAAFAGYGFPKAHAASYAQVSWRSAWCKTHFPGEFMAAVLANWGGYYSQRVYLSEARRLGLQVRPPHVNFSGRNFVYAEAGKGFEALRLRGEESPSAQSPELGEEGRLEALRLRGEDSLSAQSPEAGKALFMGLDQVRDLTRRTIERILQGRPFTSLEDFLERADPRPQEAENLVKVGALEGMGTIPELLAGLKNGAGRTRHARRADPRQPGLFDGIESGGQKPARSPQHPLEEEWTLPQKLEAQEAILGIWVSAHPLEMVETQIRAAGAISTAEAAGKVGKQVTVAGLRQAGHRSRTGKGEMMMFMTLEDLAGMLEVVVFPAVYRRFERNLFTGGPMLVTGVVEWDEVKGEPLLRAERVERIAS